MPFRDPDDSIRRVATLYFSAGLAAESIGAGNEDFYSAYNVLGDSSVVLQPGRSYRINCRWSCRDTAAALNFGIHRIRLLDAIGVTSATATELDRYQVAVNGNNQDHMFLNSSMVTNARTQDITITPALTIEQLAGSGNAQLRGTTSTPIRIDVEDISGYNDSPAAGESGFIYT